MWLQCKLHLGEIEESPLFVHPMSVFQKSVANRTLPKCGRYEVGILQGYSKGMLRYPMRI